jgi:two-component system cell cycle response regulator
VAALTLFLLKNSRMTDVEDTIVMAPQIVEPCKVLLVDDDELLRLQLSSLLQHAGYIVSVAASGEEALRRLDTEPCSIVISDWDMPEMDGIALTRHLRNQRLDSYIYVFLLTARRGKRDIVVGLQAGADDYISKDASPEEILARLETARRIVTLEQALRSANRENRRLAVTDALTGARNRRYLMKYLPREYDRCKRYGHAIALLVCDLDRFKLVNDGYGHDAGDDVLREFCIRAQACLRSTDWMARTGGEEFIVVLPETDLAGAGVVGERIRGAIDIEAIPTCVGPLQVTVSVGISAVSLPREHPQLSPTDLLQAADKCLYDSKQQGRNRVTAKLLTADDTTHLKSGRNPTEPSGSVRNRH